jgi:hypothetical protein
MELVRELRGERLGGGGSGVAEALVVTGQNLGSTGGVTGSVTVKDWEADWMGAIVWAAAAVAAASMAATRNRAASTLDRSRKRFSGYGFRRVGAMARRAVPGARARAGQPDAGAVDVGMSTLGAT